MILPTSEFHITLRISLPFPVVLHPFLKLFPHVLNTLKGTELGEPHFFKPYSHDPHRGGLFKNRDKQNFFEF